jgi:Peptidase_C39 like family
MNLSMSSDLPNQIRPVSHAHPASPFFAQYIELVSPPHGIEKHVTSKGHLTPARALQIDSFEERLKTMKAILAAPHHHDTNEAAPFGSGSAPLTSQQWQRMQGAMANPIYPSDRSTAPTQALTGIHAAEQPVSDDSRKLLAARENFISQERSQSNPLASSNNNDCAATSLAMALKMLGVRPTGDPRSNEKLISDIRFQATGNNDHRENITTWQLAEAARKNYNLNAFPVPDQKSMDSALASGHPILATGATHLAANGSAESHTILITAQDGHGNYIVNDPASTMTRTLTPVELQRFIGTPHFDRFIEVYRHDQP